MWGVNCAMMTMKKEMGILIYDLSVRKTGYVLAGKCGKKGGEEKKGRYIHGDAAGMDQHEKKKEKNREDVGEKGNKKKANSKLHITARIGFCTSHLVTVTMSAFHPIDHASKGDPPY